MGQILAVVNSGLFGLVVGAAFSVFLSIYFYRKGRQHPKLSVAVADAVVVGAPDEGISDGLEIRFEGVAVPRVTSTSAAIWNDGTVTFRREDIVGSDPIRLIVGAGGAVLRSEIAKVSRHQIGASISVRSLGEALIDFDYLDPGDGIRLNIIHSGPPDAAKFDGSIRGLPAGLSHRTRPKGVSANEIAVFGMGATSLLFAFAVTRGLPNTLGPLQTLVGGMMAGLLAVSVALTLRDKIRPLRKQVIKGVPEVVTEDDGLYAHLMVARSPD